MENDRLFPVVEALVARTKDVIEIRNGAISGTVRWNNFKIKDLPLIEIVLGI